MTRIGTDIIEISRVEKNLGNASFLRRVFSETELRNYPAQWRAENMAARFCAKEALIKVFGQYVPMNEISVLNDESGRPYYKLEGTAENVRVELGIDSIDLSLSHCREYAVAFAIGQCKEER